MREGHDYEAEHPSPGTTFGIHDRSGEMMSSEGAAMGHSDRTFRDEGDSMTNPMGRSEDYARRSDGSGLSRSTAGYGDDEYQRRGHGDDYGHDNGDLGSPDSQTVS